MPFKKGRTEKVNSHPRTNDHVETLQAIHMDRTFPGEQVILDTLSAFALATACCNGRFQQLLRTLFHHVGQGPSVERRTDTSMDLLTLPDFFPQRSRSKSFFKLNYFTQFKAKVVKPFLNVTIHVNH